MIALGAVTITCVWLLPRMRPHLPVIAPLVLGIVCMVVSIVLLPTHGSSELLTGSVGASMHLIWQFPLMVIITIIIGRLSFVFERWLLSLRRHPNENANLPAALQGFDIPTRNESILGIAGVATHPILFSLLTAVTVIGEEIFFRGLFLTHAFGSSSKNILLVIGLQAILYALTHMVFGIATVTGKIMLGVGLGLGASIAGLAVSIIGHAVYQYWVYQQFESLRRQKLKS